MSLSTLKTLNGGQRTPPITVTALKRINQRRSWSSTLFSWKLFWEFVTHLHSHWIGWVSAALRCWQIVSPLAWSGSCPVPGACQFVGNGWEERRWMGASLLGLPRLVPCLLVPQCAIIANTDLGDPDLICAPIQTIQLASWPKTAWCCVQLQTKAGWGLPIHPLLKIVKILRESMKNPTKNIECQTVH